MNYDLPTSVMLGGVEYEINADFRCILDIIEVLNDKNITNQERGFFALGFFYPNIEQMPVACYSEAIEKLYWFINEGEEIKTVQGQEKVMDWAQDFKYIISPINRIVGRDVRGDAYLHWWTFLGFYMEIGEGIFSQIVCIRKKKQKGIPLDKQEAAWYQENWEIVDLQNCTDEEDDLFFSNWGGE